MPKFDLEDLISATELTRNTASLLKQASEGSRLLIVNKNTPVAALIGMEDLRRLDALTAATTGDPTNTPRAPYRPTFGDFCHALSADTGDHDSPSDGETTLSVPLGMTPDGQALWIDVADSRDGGLHTLVVGGTGAGASSAVKVIAWGLCVRYSPERVSLVLAGKHGAATSALTALHGLPHVVHVAQPDGRAGLHRFVDDEIARRAAIIEQNSSDAALPSLVIILDSGEAADCADLLDKITTGGPGLRVHLVVTAHEPPRRYVDKFTRRIALRVRNAADSRELIGSAAAVMLSSPGSAIAADGDGNLTEVAIFPPHRDLAGADLTLSDFDVTGW